MSGFTLPSNRTRTRIPGGPPRASRSRMEESLEVWGLNGNPRRAGLRGDRVITTNIRETLERLSKNPSIRKQFSTLARCKPCWERGKRKPRMVNGRKYCLFHEWLDGKGLLGYIITGKTYRTITWQKSL